MFELVFLGTSASAPSIHRGLPATCLIAEDQRFLIDCGEGTQRQILRSGIGFKRLHHILLTHSHLDHILGIGGLVSTFTRWEAIEALHIWGGRSTLNRVENLIYNVVLQGQKPPIPIHLYDLRPGKFFKGKKYTISAFPVVHRGAGCFGYIFEEETRRTFNADIANELGIAPGPDRGKLVRGENIQLPDGRIITPDMVLGEEIPGTKVVFTGDVADTESLREYVQDADALVIESTFLESEADTAKQFGHITAKQAATLALECNVNNLLIHHVSRRYREQEIIAEAQATFPKAIVVRDLDHYIIRRGHAAEKRIDTRRNPTSRKNDA